MEVYYASQPMGNVISFIAHWNDKARHAFVIIGDASQGWVSLELSREKQKTSEVWWNEREFGYEGTIGFSNKLVTKKIEPFTSGTESMDRWLYRVGKSNLSKDKIFQEANEWFDLHPNYQFNGDNCRSFADFMLKKIVGEHGQYSEKLKPHRVQKSVCEACEHRIKKRNKIDSTCSIVLS